MLSSVTIFIVYFCPVSRRNNHEYAYEIYHLNLRAAITIGVKSDDVGPNAITPSTSTYLLYPSDPSYCNQDRFLHIGSHKQAYSVRTLTELLSESTNNNKCIEH